MAKSHIGSILPISAACGTNSATILFDNCISYSYHNGTKYVVYQNIDILGSTILDSSSYMYKDYVYNQNTYRISPDNVEIVYDGIWCYRINDIPTTNMIIAPNNPNSWYSNKDTNYGFVSDRTIDNLYNGYNGYEKVVTSADYRASYIGIPWNIPTDLNNTITSSIYVRCLSNFGNSYITLNYEGRDASNNIVDIIKDVYLNNDKWTRVSLTDIPATKNFASLVDRFKVYTKSANGQQSRIQICMPQVEYKQKPTSFIIGSRDCNTAPAGILYKLAYEPQSILFLFKSNFAYDQSVQNASEVPIMEILEDSVDNNRIYLYAEQNTGYAHLQIYTSTNILHAVINKNILDGEWHTISIHLNELLELKGVLKDANITQKGIYTARLVVDEIKNNDDYYDQAVTFVNNSVNSSSQALNSKINYSKYIAFGYNKDSSIGNISISNIRFDARLYSKDEIRWIHNSMFNTINNSNFIGKVW